MLFIRTKTKKKLLGLAFNLEKYCKLIFYTLIDISLIFTDTYTQNIYNFFQIVYLTYSGVASSRLYMANDSTRCIRVQNIKIISISSNNETLKYIIILCDGLLKLLQSVNTVCTSKIRYVVCRINPFHIHS
uniref:Transmembrane protein n=1 Tax=Heterorhabditis bacteriophora TaxID=37862 RepID=A0A1I7WEA8_HETBA